MKNKLVGHVAGVVVILSVLLGGLYASNRMVDPDKDNGVQVDPQPSPPPTPTPVPTPTPEPVEGIAILAPDKVKPGQLVVLSVDGEATSLSWQVIPPTDNFLPIDGGRRAVFCHDGSGKFIFVLAVAKDGVVEVKMHTILVEGVVPPIPPVNPVNDFSTKVASWCEQVQSPTKRDDALKLSQSFISVAATIASGVIKEPKDILEVTKTATRSALDETGVQNWVPFLEALRMELNAMDTAGKLNSADAHAATWRAIGEALRAYAESL